MSDEDELDGMSNLTSEEDGSVYLMDGEVRPLKEIFAVQLFAKSRRPAHCVSARLSIAKQQAAAIHATQFALHCECCCVPNKNIRGNICLLPRFQAISEDDWQTDSGSEGGGPGWQEAAPPWAARRGGR